MNSNILKILSVVLITLNTGYISKAQQSANYVVDLVKDLPNANIDYGELIQRHICRQTHSTFSREFKNVLIAQLKDHRDKTNYTFSS